MAALAVLYGLIMQRIIPSPFIIRQTLVLIFAAFLNGISINLLLVPHQLISGGVGGMALFTNYLTPVSVATWIIIFNIPIFIAGWKQLGRGFFIASLYGTVMLALMTYATMWTIPFNPLKDPLMATAFSGVLRGFGIGLALRVNGSMGGTDIIGAIFRKKYSISIGTVSLIINAIIVCLGGVVFGADIAALALISIFVEAMTVDKTIRGINTSKAIFIISTKPQQIADRIFEHIDRGVTFLEGEGAYYNNPRKVLYCVVSLRQLARVKYYVQQIDPEAFVSVADVSEVMGKGFRPSPF